MMDKSVPDEIIASCECSAGLKTSNDWYACPECGATAIMET